MALTKFLILRRPPLRDAACGDSSGQDGHLEGRTTLIQQVFDSFTPVAGLAPPGRGADSTGEPLILSGHERGVLAASFSPDGTRVVSAGDYGTVRLWHADGSGEPLILRGHQGGVFAASFSPDGTRVVSAGQDGTVRVWYLFASEYALIEAARASLPRQLSDAQRAKYHLPPRDV